MIDASLFRFVVEADIDRALETIRVGHLDRFALSRNGRNIVIPTSVVCDVHMYLGHVLELIEDAIWSGK